jgi:hypothetical protein
MLLLHTSSNLCGSHSSSSSSNSKEGAIGPGKPGPRLMRHSEEHTSAAVQVAVGGPGHRLNQACSKDGVLLHATCSNLSRSIHIHSSSSHS